MTPFEILALLTALSAPEPDTSYFDHLMNGGLAGKAPVSIAPCRRPLPVTDIERQTVLCGTVTVPEDHTNPDNENTVGLSFAVLRAKTAYPAADPLVYLHGGPGMGNLRGGLSGLSSLFGEFRETRDVVVFDERAAGISSESVVCHDAVSANAADIALSRVDVTEVDEEGATKPSEFLTECLSELEAKGVDVASYNTFQNALDVPVVLRALGYEEWNLYGISYGTKLTLEVMRSAPEGIRSIILDGVAPPHVRLYDTLALPMSESIDRLVADCAAEPACAQAYPDLGTVIAEVLDRAAAGELMSDGQPVPAVLPVMFVAARNSPTGGASLTPYLPAVFYELHRDAETPTLDLVSEEWDMVPPRPGVDALQAAAASTMSEAQLRMLSLALKDREIITSAQASLGVAVSDLRQELRRSRELGPLPALLDAEMSLATPDTITTPEAARAAIQDYAELAVGEASRDRLTQFIEANFDGPHLSRLLSLVAAMTDDEVAVAYDDIRLTVQTHTLDFQGNVNLDIYACQEDVPYNSFEGYRQVTDALPYNLTAIYDGAAQGLYTACEAFTPVQRDKWQEPVESDIPTISIGSGWDIQTAASWAEEAIREMSNARSFFIAEAGHGALIYQPCVRDLTAAFVENPARELDDSCEMASAVPPFYIAPWVAAAE